MTHQEKIAWAKKNNVTPPDYVLAEAKKPQKGASICCSSSKCCSPPAESAKASATDSEGNTIGWVIGIHALKCRGLSTHWIKTGAVLPPPPLVSAPAITAAWENLAIPLPLSWESICHLPDVPPPRPV